MTKQNLKSMFEWLWRVTSVILIPLIVFAFNWARAIEQRIGSNEMAIRLITQEHVSDDKAAADVNATLKDLHRMVQDMTVRMSVLETEVRGVKEELRKPR